MWVSCLSKFHLSIAMARRIGIPSFWHIHSIHNLFLLDFAMRNNNNICRKIRQSIPCALSRTEIHTLAFWVQLYLHGTAMNIASSFFLFFLFPSFRNYSSSCLHQCWQMRWTTNIDSYSFYYCRLSRKFYIIRYFDVDFITTSHSIMRK